MKNTIMSVIALAIITTGCGVESLPTRTEAFTNQFEVVNFVSTNKVFIKNEQGIVLRMTATSPNVLTNGQKVTGEAKIIGYAPSGVVTGIVVYPVQ